MGCLSLIMLIFAFMFFGTAATMTPPTIITDPEPQLEITDFYDGIPQERTEDGAFILGNPDAVITIVAFEDFLCPHCQSYQPELRQFIEEYVATGQARFEFRMLAISTISPVSFGLAECADELQPGTFWQVHDMIFEVASTTGFDPESSVQQITDAMRLPYDDMLTCLETADQYVIDGTLGLQYDEVIGTPAVGYRLKGGELQFDILSRRPSVDEIGTLIEAYSF
jgi:protein-disulfide isomerase